MIREDMLELLETLAGESKLILSKDPERHFDRIDWMMRYVGARRRGSHKEQINGELYMLDTYIMPDESAIRAGYPVSTQDSYRPKPPAVPNAT